MAVRTAGSIGFCTGWQEVRTAPPPVGVLPVQLVLLTLPVPVTSLPSGVLLFARDVPAPPHASRSRSDESARSGDAAWLMGLNLART